MTIRIGRRQFIGVAGAGLAAITLTATGCDAGPDDDVASLARTDLAAVLGAERVRAIGARYRELTPGERDAQSLRAAIDSSRPSRWSLRRQPSLGEMVRSDFEHGRTVVVHGWVLAVTEARQCALYSLLPA